MSREGTSLYGKVLIWNAIVTLITVPLAVLYGVALTELNAERIKLLIISGFFVVPFVFAAHILLLRMHLKPVLKVLGGIQAGVDVTELECIKAERRVLQFPYFNAAHAVWWFFIAGLLISWILIRKTGLGPEDGLHITTGAISAGVVAGLGIFYTIKPLFREALRLILKQYGGSKKPPFFVPLSIKLTFSMLIIIGLILTFLSFLSFVTLKTAVRGGIGELQKKKLLTLIQKCARR
jgi:hypothetical protein